MSSLDRRQALQEFRSLFGQLAPDVADAPDQTFEYYLINYDKHGNEPDTDVKVTNSRAVRITRSETVRNEVAKAEAEGKPYTDIFLASHGWLADVDRAVEQYDKWQKSIQTAFKLDELPDKNFKCLVVGLHWPSQPKIDLEYWKELLHRFTHGDDAEMSTAGDVARQHEDFLASWMNHFQEQHSEGKQPRVDASKAADGSGTEGEFTKVMHKIKGALDMPRALAERALDATSYWLMQNLALEFGSTAAHKLLRKLQVAAPRARFHLMGHSFGTIVVSAAVNGQGAKDPLPRPVDTLFLVQGALSQWSYADKVRDTGAPGYFNRILQEGLVRGVVMTTWSVHDTAVGKLYPMAAKLEAFHDGFQGLVFNRGSLQNKAFDLFGEDGAVGAHGLQGVTYENRVMTADCDYPFGPTGPTAGHKVYNLDASGIIDHMIDDLGGAHSDLEHPEIWRAYWHAVAEAMRRPRDH